MADDAVVIEVDFLILLIEIERHDLCRDNSHGGVHYERRVYHRILPFMTDDLLQKSYKQKPFPHP